MLMRRAERTGGRKDFEQVRECLVEGAALAEECIYAQGSDSSYQLLSAEILEDLGVLMLRHIDKCDFSSSSKRNLLQAKVKLRIKKQNITIRARRGMKSLLTKTMSDYASSHV